MILNRIELGTECTVRTTGLKGVLKKIYFYPTKYEIEFSDGSVDHYSSKDIEFQGITQKPVQRRTPDAPEYGILEEWSGGSLSESESLLKYHFSTTKKIMWKMLTSIETYNVWFHGIQRALPVLDAERYVHKYSFNELELRPGSFFKIRPRTIAPYFKCRIMTFEFEKKFGFTFQTTPITNEYVQFSLEETKLGVIVTCKKYSSGRFSFFNQMNWNEKSKILDNLNEIIPKVNFLEKKSADIDANSQTGINASSLSKDDIVAILVNKVLDGDSEAMNIERNKVIRGKAKAMIVKIKRGSVERPPMPEISANEPTSSGGVKSDEDKINRFVTDGVNGKMDEINSLKDRVLRGKIKAAIVKEKRKLK